MDLCKRTPRCIILYIFTLLCWRSSVIVKAASNSTACSTSRPLGLQSGAIPNKDITQSSIQQNNVQYSGYQARLQNSGAWITASQDSNAWIQIRLPQRYTISGIATQGYTGFIKQYTISISDDGSNWKPYKVGGVTKEFKGNSDVSTVVRNNIDPTISGRFFKLNVKQCDNYCALRMELYGCNSTSPAITPQACFPLSPSQGTVFTCTSPQGLGSVCTFSCKSSYVLVGGPAILCQDNGIWNDTIPVCYRLPDKPSMVQVDSSFAKSIVVSWSKPMDGSSSISDYTVVWSADNQGASKQKITTATKAILDVLPYTYYTIKVRAKNKYGVSAWSTPIRQRSDEAAPSMTPSNFAVKSLSSLSLTVTWGEIPPEGRNGIILGYYIFYKNSTSQNVPENQVIVAGNLTFTHTLKKLQFDAYFVSVAGYTRIKFGPRTSTIRAQPLEGAPSEPQNLQAMVNSSTSIVLSWKPPLNPNGKVIKYTVKYGIGKPLWQMAKQTTGVQHEMLIDKLKEYTVYYFLVYGETAQMTGKTSQIVSAKTLEDAPDKTPIIGSSKARDAYTIFLSWAKIPAADRNGVIKGYVVFYKITGQQVYHNKTINDEGKLSTEISGLSAYTEVCVKIAAFTEVGLSKNWDQHSCTNIRTQQTGPSAPLDVVLKPKTSTSLEVSWKKPKTTNGVIKRYLIFYGQDKDNFAVPFPVSGQNYHHVLTGLKKFTTYYVQIRGETTESGNASAVKSVKTLEDAPSAPVAFRAKAMSPNSIALFWSEPKESNGILREYLINIYEKKTRQKVGNTIVHKVVGSIAAMDEYLRVVHSLRPYREYVITIQAVTIKPGKIANATAKTQEGVPSQPKNVRVKLSSHSLHIQWDPPDEENGLMKWYRVYCNGERPYDFKFSDPRMKEVPVNKTKIIFDKLKPGTKYVVTVTAKTSVGEGKKSKSVSVNTHSEAPPAPTDPDTIIGSVNHHSITIILNSSAQSNGEIIAHQIIVETLGTLSKRSLDPLPKEIYGYKDAMRAGSRFYVAAEFRGAVVPPQFVLGDGKHYAGYYNAPLEPSTRYRVYIRGVTKDGDGKWIYGHPAARKLPVTAKDPTLKRGNDDIIGLIAGIVGALILIVIIVVAVLLYRRSKRPLKANVDVENSKAKSRRRFRDLELKRLGKKRPLGLPGEVINDPEHPAIPMENFAKHVHKLHKSDDRGFMIEYNKLDIGRDFQCENAYLQDNKSKNRYGNIVAYDHSRVVLSVLNNKSSTDYINASHIDGYNKPSAYIATQGPVPHTFEDFWRMVWEQQSSTIVMLTNLQERHKLKCHKYWPDETEDYGDISVKQIRCEHYADYSIRTLNVKRESEKEEREVRQFHFTVWPDHGVPEYPTAILAFRRRVRAFNPPDAGPIIVHCSAGVGRSGTFIVIDAMLDRIKAEKTVDIFNYVAYLRSRRTCMVQTEEQYTFCHDAILEAIQCGNTQILAHDLRIALSKMEVVDNDTKMTRFEKEFKTLNKVSPVLPKACYIVAMYPENKGKNRYQDILASDFSRVVLTAIDDNEITTYINAVHISGYKQQHAFIITQYPLKATITDFWRMLCEQESACVVVFQPTEVGDFPQFWPEEGKQIYDEMITVECQVDKSSSIDNLRSDYSQSEITECRFKVQDLREPEKELNIKMFLLNGWTSEDDPPDTTSMITLVAKVEKWQQQSGNGAITVMCGDGIGRSGTFCALYSVLERVKIEQVVDVLQAIKAMRIPRPGLVKTTAEYRSIHYTVQEYLAAFDDYANFK